MKNQTELPSVEKKKIIAIASLYFVSAAIILSGAALTVFSFVYGISFFVMTTQIHGAVFGAVIIFLGLRYFLSVGKLRAEVYKPTSRFSWSNFRKADK